MAHAVLTIEITEGAAGAFPVAIVPFGWDDAGEVPLDIAAVVSADLVRSGKVRALPKDDMLAMPTSADRINFKNWQILGMENLLIGRVRAQGKDNFTVQFQLFDVFRERQLAGYSFPVPRHDFRRLAHHISDLVYETLTGSKGVFSTRVAYVVSTDIATDGARYLLQVADADGFNPKTVVTSSEPLMSPSWSADGAKVAYVSFEKGGSAIWMQEIASGKREQIASFKGINGAPSWSPDGRKLAVTLSRHGNADIFIYDIVAKTFSQLTRHYAIDTEPVWSPDGSTIVFTSDRGGKPQLYRVDVGGGKASRLTFEGSYNARATFSPDGSRLAMIHGARGLFHIALLDLKTGILDVLTDGRLDETPSFAPNGSMIIYATVHQDQAMLAAVSADGRVRQRLQHTAGEVREPAWSPFRP
jgi:TolB protein